MKEAWETALVWFFKVSGVLAVVAAGICLLPVCALVVAVGDGRQIEQLSLTIMALLRKFTERIDTLVSKVRTGETK